MCLVTSHVTDQALFSRVGVPQPSCTLIFFSHTYFVHTLCCAPTAHGQVSIACVAGIITPWVHRALMNIAEEAAEEGRFIGMFACSCLLLQEISWAAQHSPRHCGQTLSAPCRHCLLDAVCYRGHHRHVVDAK